MTSEPISGLPSGTPADADLLVQSTGAAGVTQQLTCLQMFNYIASKGINNVVYVNNINGVDAVGRGTELTPYATISYAISQIASHSSLTKINAFGVFTETNLSLPRNLILDLNYGTLSVTNTVTVDSSWTGNSGDLYIINSDNLTFTAGVNFNFSLANTVKLFLQNLFSGSTAQWTILGGSATEIFLNNGQGTSGFPEFVTNDCLCIISDSTIATRLQIASDTASPSFTVQNVSVLGNLTIATTVAGNLSGSIRGLSVSGNILLTGGSSGSLQVGQMGITYTGTYTIDKNATLNTDPIQTVPLLTGGALASQITYRTLSDTLSAGYTPVNYTPTDTRVKGHLEGIDNKLGSIVSDTTNVIYVSASGTDSVGRGGILTPYASLSYALTQITTNTVDNPFIIKILSGQIGDAAGQIKIKPYVSIQGDNSLGTIINNSSDIIVDVTDWNALLTEGFLSFQNLLIFGNVNLDFTSVTTAAEPTITFSTVEAISGFSILGTASLTPRVQLYSNVLNGAIFDNCFIEKSTGNAYESVSMGTISLLASNSFASTGDTCSTFQGVSPSSGPFTGIYQISSMIGLSAGSLSLDGLNTNLKIDSSSLYNLNPSLTNGATITILDIPFISGTQASIISTTPPYIKFGFATDTLQLLFYNTSAWVTAA